MASSALAMDASVASSSFVPPDSIEDLMEKNSTRMGANRKTAMLDLDLGFQFF
jgi:hypothetical protein